MLVLSRHRDESIIIGDDIVITVVDIRGDKVRLGIAAPIEISVHRQEVYEAIQRENRQASRLEPQDARQLEHLNPAAPARPPSPPDRRGLRSPSRRPGDSAPAARPDRPADPRPRRAAPASPAPDRGPRPSRLGLGRSARPSLAGSTAGRRLALSPAR